jgi:hypothetical protein
MPPRGGDKKISKARFGFKRRAKIFCEDIRRVESGPAFVLAGDICRKFQDCSKVRLIRRSARVLNRRGTFSRGQRRGNFAEAGGS